MGQDLAVDIGTQVADAGRNETQVGSGSLSFYVADAVFIFIAVDLAVGTTKAAVHLVDVTDLIH